MRDLRDLPKLRDSLSYLFIEHAILNQKDLAIEATTQDGRILIPTANLSVLILGPGTSITHAAMKTLGESGCTVVWTGENGMRLYAQGGGETRRAYRLIHQARLVSDEQLHMQVVMNMYRFRFDVDLEPDLTLPQIRGKEGVRVRQAYAQASKKYEVEWKGRRYDRSKWHRSDPINRALSGANALLNGLCHAAVVSAGYCPGLGFIHTGRQLSFVYDIADLYKTKVSIPVAFEVIAESKREIDKRIRARCRQRFHELRLLKTILRDIDHILQIDEKQLAVDEEAERNDAPPARLWEPLEDLEVLPWS